MQLGIIGLPQSGKTTVFNALTRGDQPTGTITGKIEVHTAVVDVPDLRVDKLSAMFNPKKTIYAKVTYADIAGLDGSAGKSGISGTLLNQLAQMGAFLLVVRCFEDDNIPHQAGSINAQRDIDTMESEFIINDLIMVERKQERLQDEFRKGGGRDKASIQKEIDLFERLHAALSEEKPIRDLGLTADEEKDLSGYGFLSQKPILIILNLAEGQEAPQVTFDHEKSKVILYRADLKWILSNYLKKMLACLWKNMALLNSV